MIKALIFPALRPVLTATLPFHVIRGVSAACIPSLVSFPLINRASVKLSFLKRLVRNFCFKRSFTGDELQRIRILEFLPQDRRSLQRTARPEESGAYDVTSHYPQTLRAISACDSEKTRGKSPEFCPMGKIKDEDCILKAKFFERK